MLRIPPTGSALLTIALLLASACSNDANGPAQMHSGSAAAKGSAPAPATPAPSAPSGPRPGRPNIVVVLTDDLDAVTVKKLEKITGLAAEGLTFDNNFVSLSLCCPSRSTLLRGQYAHDTEVFGNKGPGGGFMKFHDKGEESSTIATWLKDVGYRTALMGKYLNGYPKPLDGSYVPPGWTTFISPLDNGGYGQYDYDLEVDGKVEHHGHEPDDYLTDLIGVRAKRFIAEAAAAKQPFLLYVAPFSPHSPSTAPPRYESSFPDELSAPRPPSFDEADVGDKPKWLAGAPRLPPEEIKFIDKSYHKRLQAMLAVQDLVTGVVQALKDAGKLDDTYILFTSDNGFHLGEHRLSPGKNTAFDTDLRVPLFVTGPGVPAGKHVTEISGNVDLAPTIAELAGAQAPDFVAGRSLVPFLRGKKPTPWRKCLLLEHGGPEQLEDDSDQAQEWPDNVEEAGDETDSAASEEKGKGKGKGKKGGGKKKRKHHKASHDSKAPVFTGVRTLEWSYVEYQGGEKELYDIVKDPDELENVASKVDAAILAKLHAQTEALVQCHGAGCRAAEEKP
jgi:N-acetylglucosamine-6-sulfatase